MAGIDDVYDEDPLTDQPRAGSQLSLKQATDLAGLLTAVSQQAHLGSEYRDQADYWASQVKPGLDTDGAETIAWPLQDVAGSPWLPAPIEQWARAWAASLEKLTE